ncbi:MAG TPA: universal stress protein [Gaiellaceae bacterium]|nr:universal stress protein [Gaiellaceae bacterium]
MSSPEARKRVVAAVDSSLAGNPVLVTARALARVLGARVEAIHVVAGEGDPPHRAAAAVGVPLRVVAGRVVERLAEADRADDTAAIVIGARSTPTSPHALGSTALAVLASSTKPVVVVPPVGRIAPRITRVLVPLEAASRSLGPLSPIELRKNPSLEVVALYAGAEDVEDRDELLRRYCPEGIGSVRLETRAGRHETLVPWVADELDCDLIALAWAGELAAERKEIVRAALERSPLPIMLIPALFEAAEARRAVSA